MKSSRAAQALRQLRPAARTPPIRITTWLDTESSRCQVRWSLGLLIRINTINQYIIITICFFISPSPPDLLCARFDACCRLSPGDDHYGRKQIVFSSCCLPPSHQLNHRRLLEYVRSRDVAATSRRRHSDASPLSSRYLKFTLDQYVEMDYILVYFHHGLRSSNKPSVKWLREAYGEFDRK